MTTHVGNFVIFGDIELKWLALGGLGSSLGQPVTNENPTFDGIGREQSFQGGFIAWHPDDAVKAHVVWGLIGARWVALGKEQFGYPVVDESDFPGGGKYNTFRAMQLTGHPEASIVWKPGTASAWEVYGAIRDKWISMGSVSGDLGYPIQEERATDEGEGRYQLFEHGSISWHPGTDIKVAMYRPWAVVLCRFKGSPPDPVLEGPIERFFRGAFAPGGGGLIDYWRDASLGAIDITGSRVLGWLEVEIPRSQAGGTSDSVPPGPGRSGLYDYAVKAVKRSMGDHALDGFLGPIAVYTQNWSKDGAPPGATWQTPGWYPFWIDGSSTGGKIVLTPPHDGDITAHEMGHVFGMNHDVAADLQTDYSDPCCIMSQNNSFVSPTLQRAFGPAVCLPHLMQRDWMYTSRVFYDGGGWMSLPDGITLPLAPVGSPSANANLGIKLAHGSGDNAWDYYLEYVQPIGWNRGIGASFVIVRRMSPKYGGTPAFLGLIKVPIAPSVPTAFHEASGNVMFFVEMTNLPGPILKVNAKKL